MRKIELTYELPDFKRYAFKRVLFFFMVFLLIISIASNINSFKKVFNMYSYDSYLNSLYSIKKEKGIEGLKEINNDCCAYIDCEDIDMHLPIVEVNSKEKGNYYLVHDFKKSDNELGTPYQKYGTKLGETSNTVFVGHSAYTETILNSSKKQSIFGKLNYYITPNSNYNYTIKVESIDAVFTYKVISVLLFYSNTIGSNEEHAIYETINLETESDFNRFYNSCKNHSAVANLEEASFGDKFLTLFTCSTSNIDFRVMVVAKQI